MKRIQTRLYGEAAKLFEEAKGHLSINTDYALAQRAIIYYCMKVAEKYGKASESKTEGSSLVITDDKGVKILR